MPTIVEEFNKISYSNEDRKVNSIRKIYIKESDKGNWKFKDIYEVGGSNLISYESLSSDSQFLFVDYTILYDKMKKMVNGLKDKYVDEYDMIVNVYIKVPNKENENHQTIESFNISKSIPIESVNDWLDHTIEIIENQLGLSQDWVWLGSMNIEEDKQIQNTECKKGYWIIDKNWRNNHLRIEDAECSNCSIIHPLVYNSTDNLAKYCPSCGSEMTVVER